MFALPMTLAMVVIHSSGTLFAMPFAIIALFAAAYFLTDRHIFVALVVLNVISYACLLILTPTILTLRMLTGFSFAWLLSLFLNRVVVATLRRLERLRLQDARYQQQLEAEVHEREQAQNALVAAYADVERQVVERTQALNSSLEREQALAVQLEKLLANEMQLQQMKTSIINNVSHEFRTPLHIINMSSDLLIEYRDKLSAAQSERYQSNIKEQIFYMTDMLQDILFVNSSDEIHVEREGFEFRHLCHRLQTDLLGGLQIESNVSFDYIEQTNKVFLDYTLVSRIASNLFTNALKFSEPHSPIVVRFGLENGRFLLHIIDQGIGIRPDEQARIFDLFFRGSNIETRRGLGLGLNIVQRIVEALAGTITVHSAGLDQGSEFTVELPASPPTA